MNLRCSGRRLDRADGHRDEIFDGGWFHVEPELSADDPGHVEQIVDEPELRGGIAPDDLEPMPARLVRPLRFRQQLEAFGVTDALVTNASHRILLLWEFQISRLQNSICNLESVL